MDSTTDILNPCDQAFEDRYQRSASDPHNAELLAVWRDAWDASRLQQGDAEMRADAERLDWLAIAGPTSIELLADAPHDGEYSVRADDGLTCYGCTLREAIDAARRPAAT